MGMKGFQTMDWSMPPFVALGWILASAIFLVVCFFVSGAKKSQKGNYNLPPGPPRWPILGNVNVLMDSTKPTHQIIDDLSKVYGPIMLLKVGVQNFVYVTDPDLTTEILKTQDHVFAYRPAGLLTGRYLMYGDDHISLGHPGDQHTFFRKLLVTELLSNKRLKGFQAIRMEEQALIIHEILEASARKEAVDVHDLLNAGMLNMVTRMAFSKKFFGSGMTDKISKSQQQWRRQIQETMLQFGQILAEGVHPYLKWVDTLTGARKRMQASFGRTDALLQELVDEHRRHLDGLSTKELEEYEAKDFMDVVLLMRNGENSKHITDRAIKAVTMDLMIGGSETNATLIEWAMAELLVNPDVMKRVQEEVDSVVGYERCVQESDVTQLPYLAAVVKETFRLHPPNPALLPHSNRVDCKVGGYDIPANSFVNVNVYGMAHSPSLWDNPLQFNPTRFLNKGVDFDVKGAYPQLLPFGAGRRICPGIPMAQILIHFTLARWLHSFDWSIPDGGQNFDMSERSVVTACKDIPLKANPTPRLAPDLYK